MAILGCRWTTFEMSGFKIQANMALVEGEAAAGLENGLYFLVNECSGSNAWVDALKPYAGWGGGAFGAFLGSLESKEAAVGMGIAGLFLGFGIRWLITRMASGGPTRPETVDWRDAAALRPKLAGSFETMANAPFEESAQAFFIPKLQVQKVDTVAFIGAGDIEAGPVHLTMVQMADWSIALEFLKARGYRCG